MTCAWAHSVAAEHHYKVHQKNGQVIHVVTLEPYAYAAHIVKAEAANGRETVPSIAKRTHAAIAINGGFFQIGAGAKALPSGTLVVNGKVSNIKNKTQALAMVRAERLSVHLANPKQYLHSNPGVSMVSGIPLLVSKGKRVSTLIRRKTEFYTMPHARTAIGTKANGAIVIVVAEHGYKGSIFASSTVKAQGLTMVELAQWMEKEGCQYALNLDGGGSSTLWINGKVVNQAIGDKDEDNGLYRVRAVSDAIVFHKN